LHTGGSVSGEGHEHTGATRSTPTQTRANCDARDVIQIKVDSNVHGIRVFSVPHSTADRYTLADAVQAKQAVRVEEHSNSATIQRSDFFDVEDELTVDGVNILETEKVFTQWFSKNLAELLTGKADECRAVISLTHTQEVVALPGTITLSSNSHDNLPKEDVAKAMVPAALLAALDAEDLDAPDAADDGLLPRKSSKAQAKIEIRRVKSGRRNRGKRQKQKKQMSSRRLEEAGGRTASKNSNELVEVTYVAYVVPKKGQTAAEYQATVQKGGLSSAVKSALRENALDVVAVELGDATTTKEAKISTKTTSVAPQPAGDKNSAADGKWALLLSPLSIAIMAWVFIMVLLIILWMRCRNSSGGEDKNPENVENEKEDIEMGSRSCERRRLESVMPATAKKVEKVEKPDDVVVYTGPTGSVLPLRGEEDEYAYEEGSP